MKSIDTLVTDMYSVIQGEGGWEEYHTKIIGDAIGEAAKRRFSEPSRPNNTLRMSSIGKPCERELYYDVNHDHTLKEEMEPWTLWKFFYGDMIEEAALAVARAAGHTVQGEQEEVEISGIKGHCDAIIDGMLIDVKSCSPFAFKKFKENGLREDDPFGYIEQISSYLYCLRDDPRVTYPSNAGFLAIDKVNGHIHLDVYDLSPELERKELLIEQRKSMVLQPEPPMRNYEPVADGKSGNMKLPSKCSYCGWKKECWPGLRTFIYSTGPRYLTQVSKIPNVPEVSNE